MVVAPHRLHHSFFQVALERVLGTLSPPCVLSVQGCWQFSIVTNPWVASSVLLLSSLVICVTNTLIKFTAFTILREERFLLPGWILNDSLTIGRHPLHRDC